MRGILKVMNSQEGSGAEERVLLLLTSTQLFIRRLLPAKYLARFLVAGSVIAIILAIVIACLALFVLEVDQEDLESLGYVGVFLLNLLGSGTLFIPIPGLTLAGQALIVEGPRDLGLNPVAVVLLGSSGMMLGEITAYMAGRVGRLVSEKDKVAVGGRIGRVLRWITDIVERLMSRYGLATLFVLSAIPNPLFEFAGITAGAVRMRFWHFIIAVGAGKTVRSVLLVVLGGAFLNLFD